MRDLMLADVVVVTIALVITARFFERYGADDDAVRQCG
jgi:hypothetical protein